MSNVDQGPGLGFTPALGKLPPLPERKKLEFVQFLKTVPDFPPNNPPPPYPYGMDLNDRYGICVVAGFDHLRQLTTGQLYQDRQHYIDKHLIWFYKTQNPGFTGKPGGQDDGMVIQYFLEFLQKRGYILGFAQINPKDMNEIRAATYLGLGIVIGLSLSQAQVTHQMRNRLWEVDPMSPIVGGHCVTWAGYQNRNNAGSMMTCVTWGELVAMTDEFIRVQCDEAWFVIRPEHLTHPSFRAGFDLPKFAAAFTELTGRDFPVAV